MAHVPGSTDINILRGDTIVLPLELKTGAALVTSTGSSSVLTAANLSGTVVYFSVSDAAATTTGTSDVIQKQSYEPFVSGFPPWGVDSLKSGISITDAGNGKATLTINTGESWYLQSGPYFYGVQIKITGDYGTTGTDPDTGMPYVSPPSGSIYTTITGIFNVQPNITRRQFP